MRTYIQSFRRYGLVLTLFFAVAFCMQAMSYNEARDRAWFLTDKMAYELNLTQEQYDRAYEINLDYLMSIQTPDDCSGRYWTFRNVDFECILQPWQYALYVSLDYFFRPIRWLSSAWYLPVFEHYRRGFFYFSRPAVYITYVGHDWHRRHHNTPSPYRHFKPGHGPGLRGPGHSGHPSAPPRQKPGRKFGNPGYHFTPVGPARPSKPNQPGTNRPSRPKQSQPAQLPQHNNRPQRPNRPSARPEQRPQRPHTPAGRPENRPQQQNRPTVRPKTNTGRPSTIRQATNRRANSSHNGAQRKMR